ncbi:MAG TPA: hypothetical protein EYG12_02810 [Gammaproteobacteria bacterium]|nr:hypothetical protein [Gammaproteobacteria bacterium]
MNYWKIEKTGRICWQSAFLVGFNVLLGLNKALVKLVNAGFSPLFQGGVRSLCAFLPVLIFAVIMRRRLSITDGSLSWGMVNGLYTDNIAMAMMTRNTIRLYLQEARPILCLHFARGRYVHSARQ